MKRNISNQLIHWRQSKSRKPLIVQVARQVGKTHILKSFSESEFKQCAYLNFEQDNRIN
jgi:predicted AAA+ superfamily ATPase